MNLFLKLFHFQKLLCCLWTEFSAFLAQRGASSDEPGVSLSGVGAVEEEADTHSRQTQLLSQPVEYHEELYWQRAVQDPNACEYLLIRSYSTSIVTCEKFVSGPLPVEALGGFTCLAALFVSLCPSNKNSFHFNKLFTVCHDHISSCSCDVR